MFIYNQARIKVPEKKFVVDDSTSGLDGISLLTSSSTKEESCILMPEKSIDPDIVDVKMESVASTSFELKCHNPMVNIIITI